MNKLKIETGICPVCNGEKTVNGKRCLNCGGQTMDMTPRGYVNLNKDGVPCTHQYKSREVGRCLTRYTCVHCGGSYDIDSGD